MEFITPTNVVAATKFLLKLDKTYVDKAHWPEFEKTALHLKACLDDFLEGEKEPLLGMSQIVQMERALIALFTTARTFVSILTEDARRALQDFLLSTPADKPPLAIATRKKFTGKMRTNRQVSTEKTLLAS